jgi:RNA polymerase sigma-70 factor (ECF subfamily)
VARPDELGPRGVAFAIAYRMLGTVADAEDIAQEAALRLSRQGVPVDNPDAWITTVATRLAIDALRAARTRRERYSGPWLPEPLLIDPGPGPVDHAELADTLSQALLVTLERLTPVERAAFLLREVFDYDYARIAEIIERTEVNARQLVARAKRHIAATRPRFDPDDAAREALVTRFMQAVENGDLGALEELLAADVVLWGDGGGEVVAARIPVHGAAPVARFLAFTTRKRHEWVQTTTEPVRVNGQPGQLVRQADGSVYMVVALDISGGRIVAIRMVRNPKKLGHLARPPAG